MKTHIALSFFCVVFAIGALGDSPQVSNIRASQRAATKLIDIYYDLVDADSSSLTIMVQVSSDSGSSYGLPVFTTTGDIGTGVTPGANKHIVWNAGQDWNRRFTNTAKARVIADDTSATSPVTTMAFVPAGFSNPGVEIYTSGFYMDKLEISKSLWDTVSTWATAHGYVFDNGGYATASNHPVAGISWYDVVKWCNARSEKEGLTPVYYKDLALTQVYRTGQVVLDNNWVAWTANGYRLPTRAEWLKAYWGGLAPYKSTTSGNYYPWPSLGGSATNFIYGGEGNYYQSGDPSRALAPPIMAQPRWATTMAVNPPLGQTWPTVTACTICSVMWVNGAGIETSLIGIRFQKQG